MSESAQEIIDFSFIFARLSISTFYETRYKRLEIRALYVSPDLNVRVIQAFHKWSNHPCVLFLVFQRLIKLAFVFFSALVKANGCRIRPNLAVTKF